MELYNNLVKHVENQAETFLGKMPEGKQKETIAKTAGAAVLAGIVAGVCAPTILIPVAVVGGAYAAFSYCVDNYTTVDSVIDNTSEKVKSCSQTLKNCLNDGLNAVIEWIKA